MLLSEKIISTVLLLAISFSIFGTTAFATNDSVASGGSVNDSIATSDATIIQKYLAGTSDYFEY